MMFQFSQKKKLAAQTNNFSNSQNTDSQLLLESTEKNVLIADENPEVRNALSVAVLRWAQEEQRKVKPVFVANGKKAIDYVKQTSHKNPPFLAIFDLRMCQMNGLESAQIISEICPQIPIIITIEPNENDEKLIQKIDDFAHRNSHLGFIVRTKSSQLLKASLEQEIRNLEHPHEKQKEENNSLLGNLTEKISSILN
ncbi:MAG: response regulator [Cyanobacteria bacterium P01_E01_bin.35]